MGLSSFLHKEHSELALVLDVGSGSVGGALVHLSENKKPHIVYSTRVTLPLQETWISDKAFIALKECVDTLLKKVMKDGIPRANKLLGGRKKVKRALVTLASPWYVSKTKSVVQSDKEKPLLFTKKLVSDVLKEESERFHSDISGKGKDGGSEVGDIEMIESKIIQTRLNGYETENPFGKSASYVEFSLFMSLVSRELLEHIQKILDSSLHVSETIFHSFPLIAFGGLRELYPHVSQYLLIDVTAELTDVMLAEDNTIVEIVSFPFGRNTLARKVSEAFKVPLEVAASYIAVHSEKKADEELSARMVEVLKTAEGEWKETFDQAKSTINRPIPKSPFVFLMSDEKYQIIFSEFVKNSFDEASITILSGKHVSGLCSFEKNSTPDPFLCVEGIFANRLFHT